MISSSPGSGTKVELYVFPDVNGKIGAKVGFFKTNIGLPIGELKHPLIF